MALDHEAIYRAYPKAHSISEQGVFEKNKSPISIVQSEIDAARTALNNEAAAVKYKKDRADAYPSIGDQLDMQYWDKKNGTTTWVDAIDKVKSDNPKP